MIKGWQKTSFIDYPGKISTVLFYSGCNFRCDFCHNPDLVYNRQSLSNISQEKIINYLNNKKNLLEAVVLTGGEPTLYRNLPSFLKKIKEIGYLIKLDTNGTNPEMLNTVLKQKLIDYLAMDIKAPLKKYSQITQKKINPQIIKESIKIIKESDLSYEFRSTILPFFHKAGDILAMARLIKGADLYYLQKFISRKDLVNKDIINEKSYTSIKMKELAKKCQQFVKKCLIR